MGKRCFSFTFETTKKSTFSFYIEFHEILNKNSIVKSERVATISVHQFLCQVNLIFINNSLACKVNIITSTHIRK